MVVIRLMMAVIGIMMMVFRLIAIMVVMIRVMIRVVDGEGDDMALVVVGNVDGFRWLWLQRKLRMNFGGEMVKPFVSHL